MRFNKLLAGMALLIGSSILSGCNNEPLEIPQSELYAREFYKTFGLVSPDQDWTAASRGALTVTTDKPTDISIIADVDGTTYLFGQFKAVDGQKVLDFDIPKHATNTRAIVNGRKYAFTPGSRLDLTAGSRGLINEGENTFAGVTVTVEENQKGRVLTLTPETIDDAIDFLPENPDGINKWEESNFGRVTDNFFATAKEFYLFPEYWYTSANAKNIIGVYWYVDENTPNAKEVTYRETPDDPGTAKWIIQVPFFQNPSEFFSAYKTGSETLNYRKFSALPDYENLEKKLLETYPDKYYISEGKTYRKYSDGSTKVLTDIEIKQDWSDINDELADDIISVDDSFFWVEDNNGSKNFSHTIPVKATEKSDWNGAAYLDAEYYESKGIHVEFNKTISFGFYIKHDDDVMYSESSLNAPETRNNETRLPSYVATLKNGTDTEGNDKRHLCFEDWYGNNWDLNDMIFRVYGFDNIADGSMEKGKVTDIDNPDGDDDDDDDDDDNNTTTVEYPTFPWIVACEDLGATDDYDFNDIVFGVEHVAGTRYVYVTALAAGGTLPARLYYTTDGTNRIQITGGETDDSNDPQNGNQYTVSSPDGSKYFDEWHKWFGSGRFSTEMINTRGNFSIGATVRITLSKENADKFSLSNEKKPSVSTDASISHIGGFTVEVDQEGGKVNEIKAPVITDNPADNIPQLFATTYKYKWPYERESIKKTHAGTNEVVGTTPGGVTYNKGSFMHWVIAGDDANFHETEPSLPGMTCNHGWKGDLKRVKVTDKDGNVQEYYEAYGNKFKAE